MKHTALAALTLLALGGSAHAVERIVMPTQELKAESTAGKVLVTVSVHNSTRQTIYVPKAVFKEKQLFGRVFELKSGSSEIDYAGPMVKRGPYTKADYVGVKPGATLSNTIDISGSYAFKSGSHSYTISYAGGVLPNLAQLDAVTALPAASATFTHSAK